MTVIDVVRRISSIVNQKGYDGALDESGELVKIGLNRDEGNPIVDSRVVDGFKVRFSGPKMIIGYQSEVNLKELHRVGPKSFDTDIENKFANIASFITKEYNKMGGEKLALKEDGPSDVVIQKLSNYRTFCTGKKVYTIGGFNNVEETKSEEQKKHKATIDDSIRNWLSLNSTQNPQNVTRKQPPRPGLGEVDK